ncbi:MAG: hypothetical protein IIY06_11745 [Proteobacteria bacterium]|jgi:hypothetical protein|nr:hypothetical protein [Pseudomonadota bacterium]
MLSHSSALHILGILLLVSACAIGMSSCSKSNKDVNSAASAKVKLNVLKMDTSDLDKEEFDLNEDGVIDQVRYLARGSQGAEDELRYVTHDINFDGVIDITEFYEKGEHTRDEIDLDYDGICDLIVKYKNGLVYSKEYSLDFEGNRHGIQIFNEKGQRISIQRDTDGDGRLDTIESYEPDAEEPSKVSKMEYVPDDA